MDLIDKVNRRVDKTAELLTELMYLSDRNSSKSAYDVSKSIQQFEFEKVYWKIVSKMERYHNNIPKEMPEKIIERVA